MEFVTTVQTASTPKSVFLVWSSRFPPAPPQGLTFFPWKRTLWFGGECISGMSWFLIDSFNNQIQKYILSAYYVLSSVLQVLRSVQKEENKDQSRNK